MGAHGAGSGAHAGCASLPPPWVLHSPASQALRLATAPLGADAAILLNDQRLGLGPQKDLAAFLGEDEGKAVFSRRRSAKGTGSAMMQYLKTSSETGEF